MPIRENPIAKKENTPIYFLFNTLNLKQITLNLLGMKTRLLFILLILFGKAVAQESFKKTYYIPSKYVFKDGETIYLTKEEKVLFKDMTDEDKETVRKKFPLGTKLRTEREEVIDGKKTIVLEEITVDEKFYEKQSIKKSTPVEFDKKIEANVKLVENKLIINPFLNDDKDKKAERELYNFELKNRQTIKL